ncbi:MAG: dTDP-4-dehydrorhamnose 3,5-epimerase [Candidatus Shapirobacteria bacterium]|jgi:dTDP-4-dehydrorhamnose 3,5-epimerase
MVFIETKISGLLMIEPKVFADSRGFFLESYSQKVFADNGINTIFVQDNHSRSSKNVLRGLHFQKRPFAQDKLIRVTSGEVFDVAVDIRPGSPTYGKYESAILSAENHKMFLIPAGFAHGFCVLSETVDFLYKCSNYYSKESEGGIVYNDPDLNIPWPVENPILSDKDKLWPSLKNI